MPPLVGSVRRSGPQILGRSAHCRVLTKTDLEEVCLRFPLLGVAASTAGSPSQRRRAYPAWIWPPSGGIMVALCNREVTVPSITIKNIPDTLYERIRLLARANRRSINSEIIVCLERAVGCRPADIEAEIADARALRERTADYSICDEAFGEEKRRGRP